MPYFPQLQCEGRDGSGDVHSGERRDYTDDIFTRYWSIWLHYNTDKRNLYTKLISNLTFGDALIIINFGNGTVVSNYLFTINFNLYISG